MPLGPFGPVVAVGDFIEVTTYCVKDEQVGMNVFHYLCTANTPADTLAQVVNGLEGLTTAFSTAYKNALPGSVAFWGYGLRIYNPSSGVQFFTAEGRGNGAMDDDVLPRQCAGFISKKVDVRGRRKGGRFYVSFPPAIADDGEGNATDAYFALIGSIATLLTSNLPGSTGNPFCKPVVVEKTVAGGVTQIVGSRNIVLCVPSRKFATQRRRGSYGRANSVPF